MENHPKQKIAQNKLHIPLSNGAKEIFRILDRESIEGYLVGGCVRDFLLGLRQRDFDFAAGEEPLKLSKIFKEYGFQVIDVGIEFGTVGVWRGKELFEITSFRREGGYKTFRKPESVRFTKDFSEDVKRRDFSMNALAYHPKKGILDLCGGLSDLEQRLLRAIGNPKDRFSEDALRILRGVGFVARFSLEVETQTMEAMLDSVHLLHFISAERISNEMLKIVDALQGLDQTLRIFRDFAVVFWQIFGKDFKLPIELKEPRVERILKNGNPALKIALILGEQAERLILPKKMKTKIKTYRKWLQVFGGETLESSAREELKYQIKILLRERQEGEAREWMEHFLTSFGESRFMQAWREITEGNEIYRLKQLQIDGSDLLKMGIEGRRCGEILERLLDSVMAKEIENTRADLYELALKLGK